MNATCTACGNVDDRTCYYTCNVSADSVCHCSSTDRNYIDITHRAGLHRWVDDTTY